MPSFTSKLRLTRRSRRDVIGMISQWRYLEIDNVNKQEFLNRKGLRTTVWAPLSKNVNQRKLARIHALRNSGKSILLCVFLMSAGSGRT